MSRRIDKPEPGYFAIRLVRGGVEVPARIYRPCACSIGGFAEHEWTPRCDRFGPLDAEIVGKSVAVWRVWEYGRPITKAMFEFMSAKGDWSRSYAPHRPEANPDKPANLSEMPSLF